MGGVEGWDGELEMEEKTVSFMTQEKETNAFDEEIRATGTPAYMLTLFPYVDTINWAINFPMYLLFVACVCYTVTLAVQGHPFTWQEVTFAFCHAYWRAIMSWGLLHRLFSHQAWACSRFTTFLLGLFSCTAAQRGPLWWSSKHCRHHKYCENEGPYPFCDPHSYHRIKNFFYAYLGWTIHPFEKRVDWAFVHPHYKTWEMALVESCTWLVPALEILIRYYIWDLNNVLLHINFTGMWVLITLMLNFKGHDDGKPSEPPAANGRYKCNAVPIDVWYLARTIDLLAELDHVDHHLYPRKAKRDSYMGIDVFYWTFLWPGEKLGIFWDVRSDAKGRVVKKQL